MAFFLADQTPYGIHRILKAIPLCLDNESKICRHRYASFKLREDTTSMTSQILTENKDSIDSIVTSTEQRFLESSPLEPRLW